MLRANGSRIYLAQWDTDYDDPWIYLAQWDTDYDDPWINFAANHGSG